MKDSNGISNRDATFAVMEEMGEAIGSLSEIAKAVKDRHKLDVSESHVFNLRKEFKEAKLAKREPTQGAAPVPPVVEAVSPPAPRPQTPFEEAMSALDSLHKAAAIHKVLHLAIDLGGVENLIELAKEMKAAGIQ